LFDDLKQKTLRGEAALLCLACKEPNEDPIPTAPHIREPEPTPEQVWCIRVLEFVLESRRFCSPLVALRDFFKNPRFSLEEIVRFETKSDALKSMISQS
jgi:hypothetical protein